MNIAMKKKTFIYKIRIEENFLSEGVG